MKYYAPSYYPLFSCIAGKCRHSCCAGWEIDIDEESLARYQAMEGPTGDHLRQNIDLSGETACFRLTEGERCPFLNGGGLCELILAEGPDILCQICADHPRFRNFFSDREEIGLGMCCEAAGRLILTHSEPVQLIEVEDDGFEDEESEEEQALIALRAQLVALMQDRTRPVAARVERMLTEAKIDLQINFAHWKEFLLTLERLDDRWAQALEALDNAPAELSPLPPSVEWEIAFEQLAVYLIYRHLPAALTDGDVTGRIACVALILALLHRLCEAHAARYGRIEMDDLVEFCRQYSSEIEYSDVNMDALLDELRQII